MIGVGGKFVLLVMFTTTVVSASAAPTLPTVCANSGTPPVLLGEPLRFCGNIGVSCCDAVDDDALRDELGAMDVPDATCAAIVKSVLCTRCIPFVPTTANLSVPLLCASAQGQHAGTSSSMCVERISAAFFHAMTAHPDGSGRVSLSSRRDGKVWLATMPGQGAGAALQINNAFLDLTDHDGVLGVVGVAFHPDFTTNGRFFVSYVCDRRCGGAVAGGRYLVVGLV